MSRHAKPTVSAFVLALAATILASPAAHAFGPRPFWPTRPRPTSPMPILLPIPNMDGQPGLDAKLTTTGPAKPKFGLQTIQAPRGGIHLPAMTARVPTITVRGSR